MKLLLAAALALFAISPAEAQWTRNFTPDDQTYLDNHPRIKSEIEWVLPDGRRLNKPCIVFMLTSYNKTFPDKVDLNTLPPGNDRAIPTDAMMLWDVRRPFNVAILYHLYNKEPWGHAYYHDSKTVQVGMDSDAEFPSLQSVISNTPGWAWASDNSPTRKYPESQGMMYYLVQPWSLPNPGESLQLGALQTTCSNDQASNPACVCVGSNTGLSARERKSFVPDDVMRNLKRKKH